MTPTKPTPTEGSLCDPPPFSDLLRRVEGLRTEASYITAPGLKALTDLLHELLLELQVTLKPPILHTTTTELDIKTALSNLPSNVVTKKEEPLSKEKK